MKEVFNQIDIDFEHSEEGSCSVGLHRRNIFEINSKQHFAKLVAWLIPKGELTMFYFDRLKIYLLLAEVSKEAGIPLIDLMEGIKDV